MTRLRAVPGEDQNAGSVDQIGTLCVSFRESDLSIDEKRAAAAQARRCLHRTMFNSPGI